MTSARKIPAEIDSLRDFYHSVHSSERTQVIEMLGAMKTNESVRELITLFGECEWRTTKLQIIQTLALNPTQRCLEFLFKVVRNTEDFPMAEAALTSLGH